MFENERAEICYHFSGKGLKSRGFLRPILMPENHPMEGLGESDEEEERRRR